MRRRQFIQTLAGTVACGVSGAFGYPAAAPVADWKVTLAEWFERNHQERLHRLNYERFHKRLQDVLENGHDVVRCDLRAPRGGFRFVRVYLKEGPPVTWDQPWEGECI
jgi:hypothetical protein